MWRLVSSRLWWVCFRFPFSVFLIFLTICSLFLPLLCCGICCFIIGRTREDSQIFGFLALFNGSFFLFLFLYPFVFPFLILSFVVGPTMFGPLGLFPVPRVFCFSPCVRSSNLLLEVSFAERFIFDRFFRMMSLGLGFKAVLGCVHFFFSL